MSTEKKQVLDNTLQNKNHLGILVTIVTILKPLCCSITTDLKLILLCDFIVPSEDNPLTSVTSIVQRRKFVISEFSCLSCVISTNCLLILKDLFPKSRL